jgi:hypothetical protein
MLTGAHKTASRLFTILERYHKDGDGFLSHIVLITGDGIWVLIFEPSNQRAVRYVDA